MEAYLDNAATTRPFESVKSIMLKTMEEDFGNPSSMHQKGVDAEKYIKKTREIIARSLKAEPGEIIFTSGGTESNNMAVIGTALANKRTGKHLITTKIEHPSVYNPFIFLEGQGFETTYISVDSLGHISLRELENSIREDTILISIMYVNNEIGAVQDLEAIGKLIKGKNSNTFFHVDAIQGYGKFKIIPKKNNIDLLSVSGHKLHGPKGTGFLYVRKKLKIKPIIYGGEQQNGLRSGTENVPGVAGLGKAVEEYYKEGHGDRIRNLYRLKAELILKMLDIPGVRVNGISCCKEPGEIDTVTNCVDNNYPEEKIGNQNDFEKIKKEIENIINNFTETGDKELEEKLQAPHIVSVTFPGVRSEVMLHALEEKNIFVSAGSACSANHPGISGTLRAVGLREDALTSTLRFSFSVFTTREEIELAARTAAELYPVLSRYKRK